LEGWVLEGWVFGRVFSFIIFLPFLGKGSDTSNQFYCLETNNIQLLKEVSSIFN